jgi:nucleoside-diphosphate-sugar epimerase
MFKSDLFIHLACDCIRNPPVKGRTSEINSVDVVGTKALFDDWSRYKKDKKSMFIFLSSQAASIIGKNSYGRIKYHCESVLIGAGCIILRPGFVFDKGNAKGLYGFIRSILITCPIIPIIKTKKKIHLTDLAILTKLILDQNFIDTDILHQSEPMDLRGLVLFICKNEGIPNPLILEIPQALVLRTLDLFSIFSSNALLLKERISGIID